MSGPNISYFVQVGCNFSILNILKYYLNDLTSVYFFKQLDCDRGLQIKLWSTVSTEMSLFCFSGGSLPCFFLLFVSIKIISFICSLLLHLLSQSCNLSHISHSDILICVLLKKQNSTFGPLHPYLILSLWLSCWKFHMKQVKLLKHVIYSSSQNSVPVY